MAYQSQRLHLKKPLEVLLSTVASPNKRLLTNLTYSRISLVLFDGDIPTHYSHSATTPPTMFYDGPQYKTSTSSSSSTRCVSLGYHKELNNFSSKLKKLTIN